MAAQNSIIPKPKTTTPDMYNNEPANKTIQQKQPRRSKNIFKVALFMMRGRSRKSRVLPVDEESKSVWRKLVGSIRCMHLQNNVPAYQPKSNSDRKLKKMVMITAVPCKSTVDNSPSEDGFESASEFSTSPSPTHCRYASAIGLSEMVQDEENRKEEENVIVENEKEESDQQGNGDGDEMIDAKAEEFIAQFYQQMRLQSFDVVDRRFNEISQRSLG